MQRRIKLYNYNITEITTRLLKVGTPTPSYFTFTMLSLRLLRALVFGIAQTEVEKYRNSGYMQVPRGGKVAHMPVTGVF